MSRLLRLLTGGGFSPLSISSLSLWLDAQDNSSLTFNSSTISAWSDKSGKGNNAAQATSSLQPQYTASIINNRPALFFYYNATASNLTVTDSASLNYTAFTSYVVMRPTQFLGANMHLFAKWTLTGNQREHKLPIVTGTNVLTGQGSADGSAVTNAAVSGALSVDTNYIIEFGYSGSSLFASVNRGTEVTAAMASIFNGTSNFFIGTRDTNTEPFAGYIGEVRFYTGLLTTGQRLANYQDLARKWGITIS